MIARDLHNFSPHPVEIQKENARHRIILYMKAQGMSNVQVANALGMTPVAIGIISRQPWFMEALVELLDSAGRDKLEKLLQSYALDAAQIAYEIMEKSAHPAEGERADNRLASQTALEILKAARGTKIVLEDSNKKPISELDAQIKELSEEIQAFQRVPEKTENGVN